MFGRRTGLLAGVFYASMVLPLVLVQLPTHDVALVPWVNLAMLCLWEADKQGVKRRGLPAPRSLLSSRWPDGLPWAWSALAGVTLGL